MQKKKQAKFTITIPKLPEKEVGLGDMIKALTTSVGIKPCGGCKKRAEALNQVLSFSGSSTDKNNYNDK